MLLGVTLVTYFLAALVGHFGIVTNKKVVSATGFGLIILGAVLHGALIAQRWVLVGRAPMVQLYELTVFYSWLIVVMALVVSVRFSVEWLRPLTAVVGVLCLASTSFMDSGVQPLVAALQSNWLTVHVVTCFISYAAFAVAFLFGLAYIVLALCRDSSENGDKMTQQYESLTYKCVIFGFPLLTIGIVTGAVWANSAWGTYWSWDPKEVWSLVTWLVYAIYLHLRRRPDWRGQRAILLNMLGFAAVLFTWFGVNYLMRGLHSYK